MKNTNSIPLFLTAFIMIITFNCPFARAERIKVKKSKGNQAIIETTTPLEEGQTYELSTESVSQDVDYKANIFQSRRNSVTFGGQFDFLRSDAFQRNNISLQLRYGWNFSNIEVGAFADATSLDEGVGATTTLLAGGYFDYNLIPNRDPKKIIYGVFSLFGIGSTAYPSSSTSGGSISTLVVNVGGFLTYFIGSTSTALRGELYGTYAQISTTLLQSSLAGAGGRALLIFYF